MWTHLKLARDSPSGSQTHSLGNTAMVGLHLILLHQCQSHATIVHANGPCFPHLPMLFPSLTTHTPSRGSQQDFLCLHFSCTQYDPARKLAEIFWVPDHSAVHYGMQVSMKLTELLLFECCASSAQYRSLARIFVYVWP